MGGEAGVSGCSVGYGAILLLVGAAMMSVGAGEQGEIVPGACLCLSGGEVRSTGGRSSRRFCLVKVNATYTAEGETEVTLEGKRLYDAPSDCGFCAGGANGTFPCFVNAGSKRVAHGEGYLEGLKAAMVIGLVALTIGVFLLCLGGGIFVYLYTQEGAGPVDWAGEPGLGGVHGAYGLPYSAAANPPPTPALPYYTQPDQVWGGYQMQPLAGGGYAAAQGPQGYYYGQQPMAF